MSSLRRGLPPCFEVPFARPNGRLATCEKSPWRAVRKPAIPAAQAKSTCRTNVWAAPTGARQGHVLGIGLDMSRDRLSTKVGSETYNTNHDSPNLKQLNGPSGLANRNFILSAALFLREHLRFLGSTCGALPSTRLFGGRAHLNLCIDQVPLEKHQKDDDSIT